MKKFKKTVSIIIYFVLIIHLSYCFKKSGKVKLHKENNSYTSLRKNNHKKNSGFKYKKYKLKKKEDIVLGIIEYIPKSPFLYWWGPYKEGLLKPYITVNNKEVNLRIKIIYESTTWLNINKYILFVDGQKYYINNPRPDRIIMRYNESRNETSGIAEIREISEISTNSELLQILKKIPDSNQTILRFQGNIFHFDLIFEKAHKKIVLRVLNAYKELLEFKNNIVQ